MSLMMTRLQNVVNYGDNSMKFSKWNGLGNDFIIPEPGEICRPEQVSRAL